MPWYKRFVTGHPYFATPSRALGVSASHTFSVGVREGVVL
jgi:hypothetical protein